MTDPVIFGIAFDGKGGGTELSGNALAEAVKSNQLAWVHLDANHTETRHWLQNKASYLDPLIIDALLADETRPRFEAINDGALVILRGVNLNENADPEDMVSIRLWVQSERIISLQRRPLRAVSDCLDRLKQGHGAVNTGEFIATLILRLLERMEPTLSKLDERIDDLEESILQSAENHLRGNIVDLRRESIVLRRYIAPQRDAINRMRSCELPWLSNTNKRHLQESYDRAMRYVEDLDAIRERSQIVQDELSTKLADHLNRNMYVLSVIAAIFLPLGFLTGLLGVNIGGIPGTEDPTAFALFCALLTLLVIAQIIWFKKKKWF